MHRNGSLKCYQSHHDKIDKHSAGFYALRRSITFIMWESRWMMILFSPDTWTNYDKVIQESVSPGAISGGMAKNDIIRDPV
jgi:hypothetical protein